ncbi:ATPase [Marinifilum sp. D714]|uniref:ATPase n=1 Tax=Marinifilum sp. D714 TaxID=2937523 RepID=UPI0027CA0474|nr:ATPase [Marinifilum sp. D714]MDQ2178577.1 ATPase [Marinifilum sp. D714]
MEKEKIHCRLQQKKTMPSPYEWAAELKDGVYHFSFSECLSWLKASGKHHFGEGFSLFSEDQALIYRLIVYAIGDEVACRKYGIQMDKGILLTGPVGCGKTTLMLLINSFFPPMKQFQMKSARELSFEFEKQGYDLIGRYGKPMVHASTGKYRNGIYCFDDLGVEQSQKFYGNECNVMAEILLSRYELYAQKRILTHATTNLSASELESRYGNRVRSRMRELFNLIAFDSNSKDKRK